MGDPCCWTRRILVLPGRMQLHANFKATFSHCRRRPAKARYGNQRASQSTAMAVEIELCPPLSRCVRLTACPLPWGMAFVSILSHSRDVRRPNVYQTDFGAVDYKSSTNSPMQKLLAAVLIEILAIVQQAFVGRCR